MKSADISAILNPNRYQIARAEHKAWTTTINGMLQGKFPIEITIDTAYVVDQRCFETGIKAYCWHIPERYPDEKSAETGHKKWVKTIKKNNDLAVDESTNTLGDAY